MRPGTYLAPLTLSDGSDPTTELLTIVVDPAVWLSVKSAQIKWKKEDHTQAKVRIKADLDLVVPGPDDIISLTLDGTTLLVVPFSSCSRRRQRRWRCGPR